MLQARGYRYGRRILPHDAQQSEIGSGLTRERTLLGLGITPCILGQHNREDGINAVRVILPRCRFDAEKCAAGIEALRHYRADWDPRRQAFRNVPRGDWTSHGADAMHYLAMGQRLTDDMPLPPIRYDNRRIT